MLEYVFVVIENWVKWRELHRYIKMIHISELYVSSTKISLCVNLVSKIIWRTAQVVTDDIILWLWRCWCVVIRTESWKGWRCTSCRSCLVSFLLCSCIIATLLFGIIKAFQFLKRVPLSFSLQKWWITYDDRKYMYISRKQRYKNCAIVKLIAWIENRKEHNERLELRHWNHITIQSKYVHKPQGTRTMIIIIRVNRYNIIITAELHTTHFYFLRLTKLWWFQISKAKLTFIENLEKAIKATYIWIVSYLPTPINDCIQKRKRKMSTWHELSLCA